MINFSRNLRENEACYADASWRRGGEEDQISDLKFQISERNKRDCNDGRSEWDKGLAFCFEGFGKAFERFHGNIVYASLEQSHSGGMTASAVGELLLR